MNDKSILLSKIILLPLVCVAIIYFLEVFIDFQFIISFALLIIVFNMNKAKNSFILSLFYSIILSFLVLILSMAVGKAFYFIKDKLLLDIISNDYLKHLHIISKSIVSPLLMFYSYRILFKIEKTKYFTLVKWSSVCILVVFGFTKLFLKNDYLFMSWQFIMALALQLILYKEELRKLFISKPLVHKG
jgi:hypothetical protein